QFESAGIALLALLAGNRPHAIHYIAPLHGGGLLAPLRREQQQFQHTAERPLASTACHTARTSSWLRMRARALYTATVRTRIPQLAAYAPTSYGDDAARGYVREGRSRGWAR